jgi:2-deoxy-D-gluconate 3-dehydrogenase
VKFFDLSGKNALVVGAAGDLGFAIVESLAECGASVVAIDIDPRVKELVYALKKRGFNIYPLEVNILDREAIKKSIVNAEKALGGGIDILVNSAGIQRRAASEKFSENDWDDVISINLTATFIYCQLVARGMIERGYGKIINISSIMSIFGGVTIPAYSASKGGVSQLTKAFSNDWAGKGICVNAIAPGYMNTQLNTALLEDEKRSAEVLFRTPVNRWGVPDDIKGVAILLASEASNFITGTTITVDGGYSAR